MSGLLERVGGVAESALHHAEDAGTSFEQALSHPDVQAAHPHAPQAAPDGIAGRIGTLWHDAADGVAHAYDSANTAVHHVGHALNEATEHGIDHATARLRHVAGDGVADAFHGGAGAARQAVKDNIGFAYGVGEGGVEALGSMVKGTGDLVGTVGKLATDGAARRHALDAASKLAGRVTHDPLGTASEVGHAALDAGKDWVKGAGEAARSGDLGEYLGKGAGSLAVNVGGMLVPGVDAIDAANVVSKAGEAAEVVGDIGKAAEAGRGAGAGRALADGADHPALPHAEGIGGSGTEPEASARTGGAVPADEGNGSAQLSKSRRTDEPPAADAPRVKTFKDFDEFEAAANRPEANTTYNYGSYSWKTDAQGRTIEASGQVRVKAFGRNNPALQTAIGNGTDARSTDVGFHLVADSLDGPTVKLNVVPGNGKPIGDAIANINQGAYKAFENQVRSLASRPGNTVEMRVQPRFSPGNLTSRPDEFLASYRVNGGRWRAQQLINK